MTEFIRVWKQVDGEWTWVTEEFTEGDGSLPSDFLYAATIAAQAMTASYVALQWDEGGVKAVGSPGWELDEGGEGFTCIEDGFYTIDLEVDVVSTDAATNLLSNIQLAGTVANPDSKYNWLGMTVSLLLYPNANLAYQLIPQFVSPFSAEVGDTILPRFRYTNKTAGGAEVGGNSGYIVITKVG